MIEAALFFIAGALFLLERENKALSYLCSVLAGFSIAIESDTNMSPVLTWVVIIAIILAAWGFVHA